MKVRYLFPLLLVGAFACAEEGDTPELQNTERLRVLCRYAGPRLLQPD